MLGPVLAMVNGPVTGDAIKDPNNRLGKLLAENKDNNRVVEEVYLSFFGRLPSDKERAKGVQAIEEGKNDFESVVAAHKEKLTAFQAYEKTLDEQQKKWEVEVGKPTPWTPVEADTATATGGTTLTKQADLSLLAGGKVPPTDTYTVTVKTKQTGITGLRLEVLPDPSLPAQGPGRAANGNFVLHELKVTVKEEGSDAKAKPAGLKNASADFSQDSFPIGNAIDNNESTGWAVSPQFGKQHTATFEFAQPIGFAKGTEITFTMIQKFGTAHTIGKFRLAVTTAKPPLSIKPLPENLVKILAIEADKRTPEQKMEVQNYYRSKDAKFNQMRQAVAESTPPPDKRRLGLEDLAWALINGKEFLFNH